MFGFKGMIFTPAVIAEFNHCFPDRSYDFTPWNRDWVDVSTGVRKREVPQDIHRARGRLTSDQGVEYEYNFLTGLRRLGCG